MSLQNIASPAPGQGGADRGARPVHLEPCRRLGQSTPRPYAAVPHDLVADARLKPLDVRLAAVLLRYARSKSSCWPSVKTLAGDLARCERTVQYALRRLVEAGWIASRPDPNPTGRLLVLTWRERNCTPPVQRLYTQGMPRPQAVAPESEKGREKEGLARASTERKAPEPPMTHAELVARYTGLGWLAKPLSDSLRQMAERSLANALGGPGKPPAVGLTAMVRSWRPG